VNFRFQALKEQYYLEFQGNNGRDRKQQAESLGAFKPKMFQLTFNFRYTVLLCQQNNCFCSYHFDVFLSSLNDTLTALLWQLTD
jgi:hypothetical protein